MLEPLIVYCLLTVLIKRSAFCMLLGLRNEGKTNLPSPSGDEEVRQAFELTKRYQN